MSENIISRILKPGVRGKIWRTFIVIIIITFGLSMIDGSSYYDKSADYLEGKFGISLPRVEPIPFKLGLDLQGGTHLVYKADMSLIDDGDAGAALEGVRDVIERRVNVFGVSEPVVQTNISGGEHRIIVELAGITDVNEAIQQIGETPLLEFKEEETEIRELTEEEKVQIEAENAVAKEKAEEALSKIKDGSDFIEISKEYSTDENIKIAGGNLDYVTNLDDQRTVSLVENLEVGAYTEELIDAPSAYEIYKLEDKKEKTNPFDENDVEKEVKASHLLLCHNEVAGCEDGLSKDEAYTKIKEIKETATPSNFVSLVKEYTTEPGGADREGTLGWFSKGMMVTPFEDTVFPQEVGTISFVVETQFGYHLIYKEDERTTFEYKVSVVKINKTTELDIIGPQAEWRNTELTGKNLERATVSFNPSDNSPEVSLEFDSEGTDLFADITERNIGKPVAIFLDAYPISIPTVNERIPSGRAVISGSFNVVDAKLLAQRLNAGALPVPIELISQQTVGPSLGKISLMESLKAGLAGLILVAIFMILYYRLSGVLAVFSLTIYGILVLAIFKLWPVTLTLSGMAGFILSIGMAVDANVLIFERLKEELRRGNPYNLALDEAFKKAWPSIRDGNVSTLITCFILIQFSTSVVKGFAITLGLGVTMSMLTAVVVTKNFSKILDTEFFGKRPWLFGGRQLTNKK
ncbi:MAG: protein translocase subunit SecD [Patescibacteria group bacterium]|jgi:protein-export membrane protein SecD|nr:protein translocase subunit SecD [Patescibacteria group bacterium]